MVYTTYEKRQKEGRRPQEDHTDMIRQGGVPNSALLNMLPQEGHGISDLEQRVLGRLPTVQARPQAQIPQAEAEADRLSANVSSSSPEGVKADLGRRMGADFSGVRFHTGADAAARAEAMGARAFTSGADVYFGQGGFDASVAAHELVHTVQQGVVDSAAATMSTPVGGVQMLRNPFKWAWEKTGGKLIRKNHDAIDELHEAMESGEWDQLTDKQKKAWKKKNPLAYRKYMKNKDKAEFQEELNKRQDKRNAEQIAAAKYLKGMTGKKTSMISGRESLGGLQRADKTELEKESTSAEDVMDTAADVEDNLVNTPTGIANGFINEGTLASKVTGAAGGVMNTVNGVYGAVKAGRDFVKGEGSRLDSAVDFAGNLSSAGGGAAGLADALGAASAAGKAAAGFGIISGAANVYQGAREIHEGRMKSNAMKDYLKNAGDRDDLEGDDLLLRDIAAQGKMEGTRQKWEGTGNVLTGAMDAASGIAELSGAGSMVGAGLSVASAGTKAVFAGADAIQKSRMKKKVVEQTTGLTDDMIIEFQKANNIKSFARAKQALMKAMGYTSGKRSELYADQTEKRGERLAELANADSTGEGKAATLAKGLGVEKGDNGYSADDISQAMGLRESRSAIAGKHHSIKAMAAENARNPQPQPEQQQSWWSRLKGKFRRNP